MILDTLKDAELKWREIVRLATPLDSDKPVIIGTKPHQGDFEAFTDNTKIFVNVNEKLFQKNFEDIIVPAYRDSAHTLYGLPRRLSDSEVLTNLVFDNFLFVLFHEQLHPWLCPNSKEDERKINKALYDGIRKAEPSLSKLESLLKVNNIKNLVWDTVLNISFLSKTAGINMEDLEKKIEYVFRSAGREVGGQPISHYPQGILPIVYIISANNRTTDIPISLVGAMYAGLSYNNPLTRQGAFQFFLDDLKAKRKSEKEVKAVLNKMHLGFISELDGVELKRIGIDEAEYRAKAGQADDLASPTHDETQRYLISTMTRIFDSPGLRYDSLRGFIQVLSPYISLAQKQGSPDANSKGHGSPSPGGSSEEDSDAGDQSQDELDAGSLSETLDDLLGELDKKEADDLMGEAANANKHTGSNTAKAARTLSLIATDEYYKRNSETLEIRNPKNEAVSFDLGTKKKWRLVRTNTLTSAEVSRLDYQKIATFQKATGLPILVQAGSGFYKLNEYVLDETPLKAYSFQKSGIEIPDNWVFFQDSSISMGSQSYVGTKCKLDLLNLVKYGLQKGLCKVCEEMGKEVKFGVVDFSDVTRYSGLDSLVRVFHARSHPIKTTSLSPQCGGTTFNSAVFPRIQKDLAPGKSIYTFVTDGDIQGDTTSLYKHIEEFAKDKDHAFVFVEIMSRSGFGQDIKSLAKQNERVMYFPVSSIPSIKEKLGKVLVKYG